MLNKKEIIPKKYELYFNSIVKKYGIALILLAMIIIMFIVSPTFRTVENAINVIRQVSINGILSIGMTFVIITGGIDLSIGSLVAVASVIAGSVISTNPNAIFQAIIPAILICGIFGLFNGFFIAKFGIPPFVVTLACMLIARGFAYIYSQAKPYILMSDKFRVIGQGEIGLIPTPVIIFAIVIVIGYILLNNTRFGRYVYAIGGNEKAAEAAGVNIFLTKLAVYTMNGFLTGLAAIILTSRINAGQPSIGVGYEMDAIAATVLGGTSLTGGVGSILGTIVGVLIIGIINNGLNLLGVSTYYQQIFKGVLILGAVLLDLRTHKKK